MDLSENLICIPGYNGYEYSVKHKMVRSMKNYKANRYGQFMKKYTDKNGGHFFYLSNNQNDRCKVYEDEIIQRISNSKTLTYRNFQDNDISSRNVLTRRPKRNNKLEVLKNTVHEVKFTILDNKESKPEPHCPIKFY